MAILPLTLTPVIMLLLRLIRVPSAFIVPRVTTRVMVRAVALPVPSTVALIHTVVALHCRRAGRVAVPVMLPAAVMLVRVALPFSGAMCVVSPCRLMRGVGVLQMMHRGGVTTV